MLSKYVFLIYGLDIYEKIRHIHVTYNHRGFKRACKFWLEPLIELDGHKKGDFSDQELVEINKLIQENKAILNEQLDKFYAQLPVKAIRK